jgi:hypothetical protein
MALLPQGTSDVAVSRKAAHRPKSARRSRSTFILLRCANPSGYQRMADDKPASSSRGVKQMRNSTDFFAHFLHQSFAVCESCGRLNKPVDIGPHSGQIHSHAR